MNRFFKKWVSWIASLTLLLGIACTIQAATGYSVRVSDGSIEFLNGGKTIKTYSMKSSSVTLTGDTAGNLFVCFYNTNGSYSRVKLNKQSALSISGEVTTLSMSSTLSPSVSVTLESGATVSTINVTASNKLAISGKVNTLNVGGNAEISLRSGGSVDTAMLTGSGAKLTAPAGSAVTTVETFNGATATGTGIGNSSGDTGSSGSTGQTNGVVELEIDPIYAYEGDRLSDLLGKLEGNVRAYLVSNGDEIYGTFKWITPTTTVKRTSNHNFTFTPDSSRYKSVRGTVRIVIGEDSGNSDSVLDSSVTLKVSSVTVRSGQRLRDITKTLSTNVRAYNARNQRIDGMVSWVDAETTRLTEKDSYTFRFSPTDTRYDEVEESITIHVSGSGSSDDDSSTTDRYGQRLEITAINAAANSKLSALTSQLSENVKAYDKDGDQISGSLRWIANGTTAVRNSKLYDFTFTPSSSRNKSMRGQVQIFTDGSGSSSSSGNAGTLTGLRLQISGDLTADSDRKRLYEYTEKVESMITAYDARGSRLSGVMEWVDSDTTRVETTGVYQFRFLPGNTSDVLRGQVRIVVAGGGGVVQLKIPSLNTASGRTLGDLTSALQSGVTATANGRTISGKVSWDLSDSTTINRSTSYPFLFTPDDSQYDSVDGQVRISIGVDGGTTSRVSLYANDIHLSSAQYLSSLSSELFNSVTVYDQNDQRIRGTLRWEQENIYVSKTGSYTFLFTPNDAQHQSVMGDVTISVNRRRTGSDIRLEIAPFEADYNVRLSDLTSELSKAIRATNDGSSVPGRVTWVTSPTTKVRRTAPYQFQFTPSSSRYRPMTGWVTIIAND